MSHSDALCRIPEHTDRHGHTIGGCLNKQQFGYLCVSHNNSKRQAEQQGAIDQSLRAHGRMHSWGRGTEETMGTLQREAVIAEMERTGHRWKTCVERLARREGRQGARTVVV